MTTDCTRAPYDLLALYNDPSIKRLSNQGQAIDSLDAEKLADAYHRLRERAPRRRQRKLPYFVDHSGYPSGSSDSPRREEHLALALWNSSQSASYSLPDGRSLSLLDYQFPLKSKRTDHGIGKVDLLGIIDGERLCIVELKIDRNGVGVGDTPLRAFLEALAYCAIVDANLDDIRREAREKFDLNVEKLRPSMLLLAPARYWCRFLERESRHPWREHLERLAEAISTLLSIDCVFAALSPCKFSMGSSDSKPCFRTTSFIVSLDDVANIEATSNA
jgi:hypothetical protein